MPAASAAPAAVCAVLPSFENAMTLYACDAARAVVDLLLAARRSLAHERHRVELIDRGRTDKQGVRAEGRCKCFGPPSATVRTRVINSAIADELPRRWTFRPVEDSGKLSYILKNLEDTRPDSPRTIREPKTSAAVERSDVSIVFRVESVQLLVGPPWKVGDRFDSAWSIAELVAVTPRRRIAILAAAADAAVPAVRTFAVSYVRFAYRSCRRHVLCDVSTLGVDDLGGLAGWMDRRKGYLSWLSGWLSLPVPTCGSEVGSNDGGNGQF
jgi:hypothetical protein